MRLKHTLIGLGAAAIALSAMYSCSGGDKENDRMSFVTVHGSAIYSLENTAQIYSTDTDIAYQDSAVLIIPESIYGHDISALKDSIVSAAFDTVAPDINEAMRAYFKGVVADLGYQFKEGNDSTARTEVDGITMISGDIFNLSSDILTYRVSNYMYSPGAAHGLTITRFITYDMREGKTVTLNDLFTPEGLDKLPELLRQRATEMAPAIGPTEITSLPAQGDFYVNLDGSIVFVYQPYEVASYAQGAIAIPFYTYQLSDYMSPAGLKFFGLK